jgi:hypothetical protein
MKGIIASAFADLAKQGESRLSSCLKKINSTTPPKCKPGRMNKFAERMAIFCPSYLHRDEVPRRKILEAKSPEPGGGCNVERSRMRRAIH